MKFVALDFETTGLFPARDRVIEVGLVRFSEHFTIEDEYSSLINPERDVGRIDIHGITPTMLADAPTFAEVASRICEFIDGSVLVAHNKKFDLDFLAAELARVGVDRPDLDALCTIELVRSAYPSSPRRIQDVCRFLGIEPERAHQALTDARMAARIAIEILRSNGFPALPKSISLNVPIVAAPRHPKTRQSHEESKPRSYLADLVSKLPETTLLAGPEVLAANEYLNLLDRLIEDRIIDDDEAHLLAVLAGRLGLSGGSVRMLHSSYVYALCRSALADGQVSESERRDIRLVAEALGLDGWEALLDGNFDEEQATQTASRTVPIGTRVCFTGQMDLTRSECEELAARKGLVVCPRVTKDVELLVVADPRTQSNKAQQARKYGARIMSERAFFCEIEEYPDVDKAGLDDGDSTDYRVDGLVIDVGGRIVPLSELVRDEVTSREYELAPGFASMVKHVQPSLLSPDNVERLLDLLRVSVGELAEGSVSIAQACDLARSVVLDLWSHVRAVADRWEEPTPSMIGSFEHFEDLTVGLLARSQAIVEVGEDQETARTEVAELIRRTTEFAVTYEPRVHSSHLYVREKRLRESGVIPNSSLQGMSIVITGDFLEFERDQAHRAILERGGKSPTSVSGRTYALVAGECAGWAKLERALNLGTPVVGYVDFLTILDSGELSGVPKRHGNPGLGQNLTTQDNIETFSCRKCGASFSRQRTRGRKPHECPECRGVGADG